MNAQTAFKLEILNGGIEYHTNNGSLDSDLAKMLIRQRDEILVEGKREISQDAGPEKGTGHRPEGGAKGGNQYGAYTVRMPSERQIRFVGFLLSERIVPTEGGEQLALAAFRDGRANLRQTSDLITWLLTLPELPKEAKPATPTRRANRFPGNCVKCGVVVAAEAGHLAKDGNGKWAAEHIDECPAAPEVVEPQGELESGMYRANGEIYKVYRAVHGSQLMVAKLLVVDEETKTARFQYRGLAERFVTHADKMTLEQAKEFGAIYGVCCVCAATLTDEVSIKAGIGPVCGKRV